MGIGAVFTVLFGLVNKDGEKGLLQKMADKTVLREEIRLRVIEAYNEGCQ